MPQQLDQKYPFVLEIHPNDNTMKTLHGKAESVLPQLCRGM
jgi:hypothetical protein